jgi:hypothetical protein
MLAAMTTLATLALTARVTKTATSAAGDGHASLYETCAALIVAVLVVLYFDERVRRGMPARIRGQAIGWLGAIIGVGLLIPLFALAGFTPDTARIREITVGQTLVFLAAAFGVAMQIWGTEDAARLRNAQTPPPVTVPPVAVPPPRPGQTEREHAAEVLGAALTIFGLAQPDAVTMSLAKTGPASELHRLRQVSAQWVAIQPALAAITAGYPSAEVRKRAAEFMMAASKAIAQPASLLEGTHTLADSKPPGDWQEQAAAAYAAAAQAFDAVTAALHENDPPGPWPAVNGRRPPIARTSAQAGTADALRGGENHAGRRGGL